MGAVAWSFGPLLVLSMSASAEVDPLRLMFKHPDATPQVRTDQKAPSRDATPLLSHACRSSSVRRSSCVHRVSSSAQRASTQCASAHAANRADVATVIKRPGGSLTYPDRYNDELISLTLSASNILIF